MSLMRSMPALLLVVACATSPTPDVAAPTAPAVPEEAVFTLRREANILVTERSRRTGDRLQAEMTLPNGARLFYEAHLRADGSVSEIEVRQFAAGASPDADPAQRSAAAFRGDSVFLSQAQGAETRTDQRALGPAARTGIVPFINPSPSGMEQLVRRARAMGGERVEVPIWVPGGGGQMTTATVTFTAPDSAQVVLGDVQMLLRVDPQGRVLGGSVPAQGLTLERTASGTP